MKKLGNYTIAENQRIARSVYRMTLMGDTSAIRAPGQFVNIELPDFYLRRPISVHDWNKKELTIIYKAVGHGTEKLSQMAAGESLHLLTGLGNGYDIDCSGDNPLLVGGGCGVPPLYALAKKLITMGKTPKVVLGFNEKADVFCEEEFRALGLEVAVTTADGSYGIHGFVTDALPDGIDYTYACGPESMLKALYRALPSVDGQYSFEERMGCGFGACMGCSCETKYGAKRICVDGPVLKRGEIIW